MHELPFASKPLKFLNSWRSSSKTPDPNIWREKLHALQHCTANTGLPTEVLSRDSRGATESCWLSTGQTIWMFTCVKTVVKNAMRKVSQAAMLFDSPGQPCHPRLYSLKEPIPVQKGVQWKQMQKSEKVYPAARPRRTSLRCARWSTSNFQVIQKVKGKLANKSASSLIPLRLKISTEHV